jgi:protein TonB
MPSSFIVHSDTLTQRVMKWIQTHQDISFAIGLSIVVHSILLALQFKLPTSDSIQIADQPLEVVLVNAKSDIAPNKPQALAQANLEGGGNQNDLKRMAESPLAKSVEVVQGSAMTSAEKKLKQLEAEQKKLLSQLQRLKDPNAIPVDAKETTKHTNVNESTLGEQREAQQQISRLEARIAKNLSDYNARPRRHFFSPSTSEYRFAQYVEEWRHKIEQMGTEHYPPAARGKLYGQLRLTAFIRSNGSIEKIEIDRSSGHDILDQAAIKVVKMGAPYPPFPPNIAADTDVLAITRTWIFTNESLETLGNTSGH